MATQHEYENWCDTCDADTPHDLVPQERLDRWGYTTVQHLVCTACGGLTVEEVEVEDLIDPDMYRDEIY